MIRQKRTSNLINGKQNKKTIAEYFFNDKKIEKKTNDLIIDTKKTKN